MAAAAARGRCRRAMFKMCKGAWDTDPAVQLGPSRFARRVVAASPRGSSGRAFPETTEEAARASSYRPHLPLHKAASLSPRVIAAPVRLLPRAGGRLPAAPCTPSACLEGQGPRLTHAAPKVFPQAFPHPRRPPRDLPPCPILQIEKSRPHRGHSARQGTSNPGRALGSEADLQFPGL